MAPASALSYLFGTPSTARRLSNLPAPLWPALEHTVSPASLIPPVRLPPPLSPESWQLTTNVGKLSQTMTQIVDTDLGPLVEAADLASARHLGRAR
jgi:hypothetical protein